MYSQEMYNLGTKRSVIRELFEYGSKRASEIGKENVFDFSLGNPNVPAPHNVKDAITKLLTNPNIHAYTSAQGDVSVRKAIADNISTRFGIDIPANLVYMTVGAAASLTITLKALNEDNNDFITFAPFFPEYTVFTKAAGGNLKVVPVKEDDFQINFDELEKMISFNTKAIIVNSPNNPSGVIYTEENIIKLTNLLREKSQEYNHPIFLISDEPYREIVYGNISVPYLMNYYNDTIVCYSYSKSLSLPGERIGYIAVSPNTNSANDIYACICGAGRALGYVCAPSLMQFVIKECCNMTSNLDFYTKNRDLIYDSLTKMGYSCIRPDGAFYLFVKALEEDANAFCERAKNYELLLVPGDDFGAKGYVRIAYCVSTEQIQKSLPSFKRLIEEYDN